MSCYGMEGVCVYGEGTTVDQARALSVHTHIKPVPKMHAICRNTKTQPMIFADTEVLKDEEDGDCHCLSLLLFAVR